MYIKIITDTSDEPVTLVEAKTWMRVLDYTYDDLIISNLIKSCRSTLESYTGLSFKTKTIECIIYINKELEIPYSPLQVMNSVYRRENESWVLAEVDKDYWIIGDKIKVSLPAMYKLNYLAGYTSLPEALKTDIKVLAAWQYENRGIKFNDALTATNYPLINLLNARNYRKVVI